MYKIVSTINNYNLINNPQETLDFLLNSPIDMVRINFSKEGERVDLVEIIEKKLMNRGKLQLMLDLPLPYEKTRLYFHHNLNENIMKVLPGKKYKLVCGGKNISEAIYTRYYEDFFVGESVFVGDGEGVFSIVNKSGNIYELETENMFEMINGKSINRVNRNMHNLGFYRTFVNRIKPDILALSFVEKKEDIIQIKKLMPEKAIIFSKIETQKSLENIQEILTESDGIMIGRGDLAIYSALKDFFSNQEMIIKEARKHKKPVYVATDILSSMESRQLPTRSEIIDLSFLLKSQIDGLVFSAKIQNFKSIVNLIKGMNDEY